MKVARNIAVSAETGGIEFAVEVVHGHSGYADEHCFAECRIEAFAGTAQGAEGIGDTVDSIALYKTCAGFEESHQGACRDAFPANSKSGLFIKELGRDVDGAVCIALDDLVEHGHEALLDDRALA